MRDVEESVMGMRERRGGGESKIEVKGEWCSRGQNEAIIVLR